MVATALVASGCGATKTKNSTKVTVPVSVSTSTVPSTTASSTTVAPSTTAAPATAAPAVTIDPGLAAKAMAAVMQASEFPYGWSPVPAGPTGGLQIERLWQNLTQCLKVDSAPPTPVVASSPTYLRGLATQAVSTVEYTTPASAAAIAAALGGPMLQGCLTAAFNANSKLSAPQGAVPGPAMVSVLTPPQLGDKAFHFLINVTQNLGSLQIKLFHDFQVVVKGSAVIRTWFLNPGSGFPPSMEQTLEQNVVGRA